MFFKEDKETLNLLGSYTSRKEPRKINPKEEEPKETIREKIVYRDMGKIDIKAKTEKKYNKENFVYAGFLDRFLATLMDCIILLVPIAIMQIIASAIIKNQTFISFIFEFILPLIATILFWTEKGGTPGKLIMNMYIVDEKNGEKMNIGQSFIRYIAYIPSMIIGCLGFIWIAFDDKKQGWHDKIAGTVVIKKRTKEVEF